MATSYRLASVKGPVPIVAYVTKGLADVATDEVRGLAPAARLDEPGERFFFARLSIPALLTVRDEARTIDDLRLLVAGPTTVTSTIDFQAMLDVAARRTHEVLGDDRLGDVHWSITMAARSPVWRTKPAWDPAPPVRAHLFGADPAATSRRPVDVRLQIDGRVAHASVNLTARPIGKHAVAVARPGALRPTVAAALVRLALRQVSGNHERPALYDPFCGTGTIVAAATQLGLPVFASDRDPAAVELTRDRLEGLETATDPIGRAELLHRIFGHDVTAGVPTRGNVPLVVGNLPWGKQIRIDRRGELFDGTAAIVARALHAGGACALLTTNEDQLAARIRRHSPGAAVASRRLGLLGQTPAIVLAGPEPAN